MRALTFTPPSALALDLRAPEPVPDLGDTLVKVRQAGICSTDLEITRGYMAFTGTLGHEFVGTVVSSPRKELVGQRVVGEINVVCSKCDLCLSGLSTHCRNRSVLGILNRPGCFADFVRLPADNLHLVPKTVDDDAAVFVEPLAAACEILRQVPVTSKTWVTVLGDGRLGLLCAQVLARAGAPVRVLGRSPNKLALCERWGVSARLLSDVTLRHDQDIVVDCTGSAEGLETALALCRPRGTLVMKSTFASGKPINLAPLVIDEITMVGSRCGPFKDALRLLESKSIDTASLISRRYKLDNALQAMLHASQKGVLKVLLTME